MFAASYNETVSEETKVDIEAMRPFSFSLFLVVVVMMVVLFKDIEEEGRRWCERSQYNHLAVDQKVHISICERASRALCGKML